MGLDAGIRFPTEARYIFFSIASKPTLGPTQPLIHLGPGALSSGCKARGAWRWPFTSIQCRGQEWWSYTSTPHMSSWLGAKVIKQTDNFTFTIYLLCIQASINVTGCWNAIVAVLLVNMLLAFCFWISETASCLCPSLQFLGVIRHTNHDTIRLNSSTRIYRPTTPQNIKPITQNIPTVNIGQCKGWAVQPTVNVNTWWWPRGRNM
jgi:hypothetical protein